MAFGGHLRSVPERLVQEPVEVRASAAAIKIFHKNVRVAGQARSRQPNQATSNEAHRPKSHQRHLRWTPSRLLEWGQTVGPLSAELLEHILAAKRRPNQGCCSCLGILQLGEKNG